ncbi:unnamed protein product [Linum trigynum]|uniref:Uncharacterized protein n=1 Tax=Linum trigynum TaxID=586398 RepID=A0AAV2FAI1_9ROSI
MGAGGADRSASLRGTQRLKRHRDQRSGAAEKYGGRSATELSNEVCSLFWCGVTGVARPFIDEAKVTASSGELQP